MRTLSFASASLLGLLATGLPAQASETPDQLVVVRDAETGQLRAPTADELAALQASQPKAAATLQRGAANAASAAKTANSPLNLQTKRHASGAVGVRATPEIASYAVVAKRADGTLAEACFESKSAADQAIESGALPAAAQQQQQQQAEEK